MTDERLNKVTELFENSDIPRRWWHTKYGYYLLYRQNRFFFAFIAQIIFVMAVLIGGSNIVQVYYYHRTELSSSMVTSFLVASISNGISDLLIYNFKQAIQWLSIAAVIYFVIYRFYG